MTITSDDTVSVPSAVLAAAGKDGEDGVSAYALLIEKCQNPLHQGSFDHDVDALFWVGFHDPSLNGVRSPR
jgi:hypothetical protein